MEEEEERRCCFWERRFGRKRERGKNLILKWIVISHSFSFTNQWNDLLDGKIDWKRERERVRYQPLLCLFFCFNSLFFFFSNWWIILPKLISILKNKYIWKNMINEISYHVWFYDGWKKEEGWSLLLFTILQDISLLKRWDGRWWERW